MRDETKSFSVNFNGSCIILTSSETSDYFIAEWSVVEAFLLAEYCVRIWLVSLKSVPSYMY
jgi:hypothetical protein